MLARRLLQQLGTNPRFLTLSLDAKDRALWTADFVQAATRLVTDDTGAELTDLYQVDALALRDNAGRQLVYWDAGLGGAGGSANNNGSVGQAGAIVLEY